MESGASAVADALLAGRARAEGRNERVGEPAQDVRRRRVGRVVLGRDHGGAEPRDRRGDRRSAARHGRGRRARRRGSPQGLGRVARQDAEGPHGAPARPRRHRRGARRGARAARVAQRRQALVGGQGRAADHRRQPPLLRRCGAQPRGQGRGGVRRGLHLDDPARAARDRGRHRPLELPLVHGRLEDGPGARGRQRPDHQAGGADAAHRAALRRARPGRDPTRRPAGRHR